LKIIAPFIEDVISNPFFELFTNMGEYLCEYNMVAGCLVKFIPIIIGIAGIIGIVNVISKWW